MTGIREIDRTTIKAAIQREKAAWDRYKGHCLAMVWAERGKFVRDETSIALFNEWQILYSVKRDLMGKRRLPRRPYRKGGLNLCRS